MKWATVAGVAVLVLLIARQVQAAPADPYSPKNWNYIRGYTPGTGYYA